MTKIEGLEQRQMLAATPLLQVKSVVADNRGEVVVQFTERATGVKGSAAQIYTAGADGRLFTDDDVRINARFTYSEGKKQLTLSSNLKKDTPYRIKLDGKTRIRSEASGALLDGDNLTGSGSSGDGRAGGNYEAQFQRDRTSTPTVRFNTSLGIIDMRMRGDVAPRNVSNFLSYVNSGRYDKTIFTRGIAGFIVQGGALQVTGSGNAGSDVKPTTQDAAISDEARVLSNTRGTVSIAKSGPNTVTNQFFFNLGDNSSNLDNFNANNGTFFTPFAQILNAAGLTLLDQVANSPTQDLSSAINAGNSNAGVNAVPVRSSSVTAQNLRPSTDLFQVTRAGTIMIVGKKS